MDPQIASPIASGPLPNRSSGDTADIPYEEILQRLELGRLQIMRNDEGSSLSLTSVDAPETDRRMQSSSQLPSGQERRKAKPLEIPTLFPARGPILILLVGGFANDNALRQPVPFWGDNENNAHMLWQALSAAGLLHRKDSVEMALGRGGFWDDQPPRTHGLAMTYSGFKRRGEVADFERMIRPWNLRRLQTMVEACLDRSMGHLKIVTLGEAARFMMCAAAYGMPGIPILSIPDPSKDSLSAKLGDQAKAKHWIEWAADLLAVGREEA